MSHSSSSDNVELAAQSSSADELDEDEAVELLAMPATLWQTVQDITGKAIPAQHLMRLWDLHHTHGTADARASAVLKSLLVNGTDHNNPANKRSDQDIATAATGVGDMTASTVAGAPSKRVIDVRNDSDDEELDARPRVARRLDNTSRGTHASFASHSTRARPSRLTAKRSFLSIDSDDDDEDATITQRGAVPAIVVIFKCPGNAAPQQYEPKEAFTSPSSSDEAAGFFEPLNDGSLPVLAGPSARRQSTPPTPIEPEDRVSQWLAQVLAMVPDIDTDHAKDLVEKHSEQYNCVEHVVEALFANPYPRAKSGAVTSKGKGRMSFKDEAKLESDNWLTAKMRDLPGPRYCNQAFELLCCVFSSIPRPWVRKRHIESCHYYAIAYRKLETDIKTAPLPYKPLINARKDNGKMTELDVPELLRERTWLIAQIDQERMIRDAALAAQQQEATEEAAGLTIECGCCFGQYVFSKMIQCPDAHLFCIDCAKKNAENELGMQKMAICCMDADGCTLPFTQSELKRCLGQAQLELLDRLRAERAIEGAMIEGLAKCPYCPWAVVIEDSEDKLLRCGNEECMRTSCRQCQKVDHLPKSCGEYAEDLKKNSIHKVEEAMSEAFIRKCPQCKRPFMKEYGCNKMTCSNCGALSCFVCSKQITGYEHFDQRPNDRRIPKARNGKCRLHEDSEKALYEQVEAARKAAAAEVKAVVGDDQVNSDDIERLAVSKPHTRGAHVPKRRIAGAHRNQERVQAQVASHANSIYHPHVQALQAQHQAVAAQEQALHAQRLPTHLSQFASPTPFGHVMPGAFPAAAPQLPTAGDQPNWHLNQSMYGEAPVAATVAPATDVVPAAPVQRRG